MQKGLHHRSEREVGVGVEPSLTESEARLVLRRQFIGSVVVAILVSTVAGVAAMRPSHGDSGEFAPSRIATVQQPTFVAPADRVLALKQLKEQTAARRDSPAGL